MTSSESSTTVSVEFEGQKYLARRVEISSAKESFSEYVLGDGSTMRLRVLLSEVLRVDGRTNPDGSPLYLVKTRSSLETWIPDELRDTTDGKSKS